MKVTFSIMAASSCGVIDLSTIMNSNNSYHTTDI